MACCLNEIVHRNAQHETTESDEKIRFMFQIFDRLNSDTLLHICVANVDKTVRGHGLASRLIAKSMLKN